MPPTPRVSSITGYVEFIEKKAHEYPLLWFRGVGRTDFYLTPSLFRIKGLTSPQEFLDREERVLNMFKQHSIPHIESNFMDRANVSDWNYLFMMQHFGIPTRLLDWSENALIALYFAVSTSFKEGLYKPEKEGESYNDASVWVLDPKDWNKHILKNGTEIEDILNPTDADVAAYKPYTEIRKMSKGTIAIYGDYNSKRIAAQQGVFTLFGAHTKSMEDIRVELSIEEKTLFKIDIEGSKIPEMYTNLRKLGFRESVVYPDLAGLSSDLTRLAWGEL